MATVAHKQLLDVANTAVTTKSGWKMIWAAAHTMLAAGWTLIGSSDGTTKNATTDPAAFRWRNAPGTLGTSTTSGSGAVIGTPARGRATVTGLTGMTSAMKGSFLKFSGSATSANNNCHQIVSYVSATSVVIDALNFAVAADATGLSWDVRNPLTESYPSAQTAAIGWAALRGPGTIKIPITAAPSGRLLRNERIVQTTTGFEGELRDVVWDVSTSTGYLTVLGQVRGTGAGVYGLTTGEVFTGQSTGHTVTQNGTAKEYRVEVVFWKAANDTTGSWFCGTFDINSETSFTSLIGAAGCTATVPPGGGGSGNTFPTYAFVAWGNLDNTVPTQWAGHTGSVDSCGACWAIAADAIEEQGYSADPTWACSTIAALGCTWQTHGLFICDGGDYGDVAPWVTFTPNGSATTSDPTQSRTAVAAGSSSIAYSTVLVAADTSATTTQNSHLRGWMRRGFGDTADQFLGLSPVVFGLAASGVFCSATSTGYGSPVMSACHVGDVPVLLPHYVVYTPTGSVATYAPAKYIKGQTRWLKIVEGGIINQLHDSGSYLQLSTGAVVLAVGPFNGTAPVLQASRFYFATDTNAARRIAVTRKVSSAGVALNPSSGVPADPGAANWYPGDSGKTVGTYDTYALSPVKHNHTGTGILINSIAAIAGTRGEMRLLTAPLAAQTISGTVKGQMRCRTNNAAGLSYTAARLLVLTPTGTVRGVLRELLAQADTSGGLAFTTSATNRKIFRDGTLSSVDCLAGDRVALEIGVRSTNATGFITVNATCSATDLPENETTTTDNAPWIEFSTPLVFLGSGIGVSAGGDPSAGSALVTSTEDTTEPTLSNFTPADGATLAKYDTVAFDVTDDTDVTTQVSAYIVSTDTAELVWNGDGFENQYSTSTRTAITNGYHYVLRRVRGWPTGGVRIRVRVVDSGGNIGVLA